MITDDFDPAQLEGLPVTKAMKTVLDEYARRLKGEMDFATLKFDIYDLYGPKILRLSGINLDSRLAIKTKFPAMLMVSVNCVRELLVATAEEFEKLITNTAAAKYFDVFSKGFPEALADIVDSYVENGPVRESAQTMMTRASLHAAQSLSEKVSNQIVWGLKPDEDVVLSNIEKRGRDKTFAVRTASITHYANICNMHGDYLAGRIGGLPHEESLAAAISRNRNRDAIVENETFILDNPKAAIEALRPKLFKYFGPDKNDKIN